MAVDSQAYQLKLSDDEAARLGTKVWQDYRNALSDHNQRIGKFAEYFRRWRCLVDPPRPGEEDLSNFPVPVCRWYANQKWAANADAIFGDDAQIIAVPVGPCDARNEAKISKYMTWRVFNSMKLTNRLLQFELYKIVFGRVHAYSPWVKKQFYFDTSKGTATNVLYKGPDFEVMEPDDFIVPAEKAETMHDFSFVIRKVRVTPQQLLDGELQGRYQGIKKNFKDILALSYKRQQRESEGDIVVREKDAAEAVVMENPQSAGSTLLMLEWYGRWRCLKRGQASADESDVEKRNLNESDIVVRTLPDLGNKVIGCQDLRKIYVASPNPRPFVEASYKKDGSYWCDGLMAELQDIEDEVRSNHNLGTDGMGLAVAPPTFFKPAQGFDPKEFKMKPGMMIPSDNPQSDTMQMKITFAGEAVIAREQALLAYGERLTGMTDQAMGRQSDRPNAPRTASGQAMLLQAGNLRMTIDTVALREDYAIIFSHFWLLEWMFSDPETFFRVTEEDANGLFPVQKGGSYLTQSDRSGTFDFRLKLATSQYSREADKQNALACYQLDLQNPLIVTNPNALWKTTAKAHKALGDPNFSDLVPEPPMPDTSLDPKQEWAMCQQGEEIYVHPMDNDQLHMVRHMKDLNQAVLDNYPDNAAILRMKAHYVDHVHALSQKAIVQAVVQHAVQQASQMGLLPPAGAGGGLPPGVMMPPGGAPIQAPLPVQGSVAPPIHNKPFKRQAAKPPVAPSGPPSTI